MPAAPSGLHHVTAIATEPQANADFYYTVLGLRLVKTTVNFDDPGTYHLYYGNESGDPGTLITFFPWPGAPRGRRATGQATTVAFSIPQGSVSWWRQHLGDLGVAVAASTPRGGEESVVIFDPDGLRLGLVADPAADPRPPWEDGPIPAEHGIRGLHSVVMTEAGYEHTARLSTDTLGLRLVDETGDRFRFATGNAGAGATVDVVCSPEAPRGLVAAGTVHHFAWRTPTDDEQAAWRETLLGQRLNVTPIIDRQYFRSIYFREPGGVLLEIATDPPGFATDEPLMRLGRSLRLPPWLEPSRDEIEHALPALKVPGPGEEIILPHPGPGPD